MYKPRPWMPSRRTDQALGSWSRAICRAMIAGGISFLIALPAGAVNVADNLPGRLDLYGTFRSRWELWNFFEPDGPGDHDYTFLGLRGRFGLDYDYEKKIHVKIEGQANGLIDLPAGALGPPLGPLGLGAVYRGHNRRASDGSVFLNQAWVEVEDIGISGIRARGGRFAFSEGAEFRTGNPGLDWVSKFRISERLIGPFDWSHVGRSFDGGLLGYDAGEVKLQATYLQPRQAGFDLAGNKQIDGIDVVYASANVIRPSFADNGTGRLFYIYYGDQRGLVPGDNRAQDVRAAGARGIALSSFGGNWTQIIPTAIGPFDGMVWGVLQTGRWAAQNHSAWAYAVEGGIRPQALPWKAWIRAGINRSSGDDNAADSRHETFFQMLPTTRLYSLSTAYNLMNNQDIFAQLILKPVKGMVWRTDLHWISLTEKNDLWYFGGGATLDDRQIGFGYGTRPSAGARNLMTALETQLAYAVNEHLSFVVYYGHQFGNTVVGRLARDKDADFGYIEVNLSI